MSETENFNIYLAPMEGITGYVFRNAHYQYYGKVSRYFTPFIAPNRSKKLTSREMNDILPEHNQGIKLIPQILTNRAEDFLWAAGKVRELGYDEVNLNLGCPSGTVVSKYRGAGFLAVPEELDRFLETVSRELEGMGMRFSVKTRIGKSSPEEFGELLRIFNQYPLARLIIHPRVQTDFYRGQPDWEVFSEAVGHSRNPVCYNGDIFSVKDFCSFEERFPQVKAIMLGRGLLQNPALAEDICLKVWQEAKTKRQEPEERRLHKNEWVRLRHFHDAVLDGYKESICGDRNVLFKMKELWTYLGMEFAGQERLLKRIKKAGRMEEYTEAVDRVFERMGLQSY